MRIAGWRRGLAARSYSFANFVGAFWNFRQHCSLQKKYILPSCVQCGVLSSTATSMQAKSALALQTVHSACMRPSFACGCVPEEQPESREDERASAKIRDNTRMGRLK